MNELEIIINMNELEILVKKFLALSPSKKGTKYTYSWGAKSLTLDIKSKKIRGASFENDRAFDFLEKMEKLGFGENIFHTLSKLSSSETSKGWDTILTFDVV